MTKRHSVRSKSGLWTACAAWGLVLLGGCGGETDGPSGLAGNLVGPSLQSSEAASVDYVVTPGGLVHKSCIHELPSGAVVDEDDDVTLDGQKIAHVDPCQHPPARGRSSSGPAPGIDENVEYAGAQAPLNSFGYDYFNEITASVIVPTAPTFPPVSDFFWTGLQQAPGLSGVLQPVLIYGTSDAGGGNFWSVGLWYISASGNEAHVGVVRVSRGDTITGTVKLSCTAPTSCKVLVTAQQNGKQILSMAVHTTEYWQTALKGVLELHGVNACNQLPPNGATTFSNVHVYMPGPTPTSLNDVTSTLAWGAVVNSETPNCGFAVRMPTPNSAALFY